MVVREVLTFVTKKMFFKASLKYQCIKNVFKGMGDKFMTKQYCAFNLFSKYSYVTTALSFNKYISS